MLHTRAVLAGAACLLLSGQSLAGGPDLVVEAERMLRAADVGTDGPALLNFFRKRTVRVGPDELRQLVRQLGDRSFSARRKASEALTRLGARAVPALREATVNTDLEVRRRAEECLRQIRKDARPDLVTAAARLIAARKPDGAAAVLLDFVPSIGDDGAIEELHAALAAVAVRAGKADSAAVRALADKTPERRAAAAVALCRGGAKEHFPAVRKLLEDPAAVVRLNAALALADVGEKEAVPVLIRLFEALPRASLWRAEDILYQLAGANAPVVAPGATAESRQTFRDAWLAWWDKRGAKADLSVLHKQQWLDYTLIVLLDEGVVLELDSDDKVRFKIEKVNFPLDAQMLPGERVLLAEFHGNRVTERARDGTVLWEKRVTEPIVAQRLSGGRTFIASKERLIEVDRAGRVVFSHARPGGEDIMRAAALPDGTFACVTQDQRFIRLDRSGKQLSSFKVRVHTSGGRIDVLPNGNVLVPQMYDNRVVEYDAGGKVVRQFMVGEPIAATRLPNGNTLITSMNEKRAVELDLAGKEVWEYKRDTRVTRAVRR